MNKELLAIIRDLEYNISKIFRGDTYVKLYIGKRSRRKMEYFAKASFCFV